ncbi:MAG: hypothetical protein ACI9R3_003800 [Verrucomicrobiales bacterium]|jgi:hypothetical protein
MSAYLTKKLKSPRIAAMIAGGALLASVGNSTGQDLTPTEKEAILAEIEKIEKTLDDGKSKNNIRMMGKLKEAVSSHNSALNFYLNCVKSSEWDAKGKRESEWREWRDGEDDFKDSGYARARQYQIRYLILTIQASMLEDDDESGRVGMLNELAGFISAMVGNYSDVVNHADVLGEDVLGGVIAKDTKLDASLEKPRGWASSPASIDSMYESTILPYYREKRNASSLRKAWESRISQLAAIKETVEPVKLSTRVRGGVVGSDRGGRGDTPDRDKVRDERKEKADEAASRVAEFKKDRLPELQWQMERDSFVFGTKRATAARAMGSHIRKHLDHTGASSWIVELKKLASGDFKIEDYIGEKGEDPKKKK